MDKRKIATDQQSLGEMVRQQRIDRGFSQRELARLAQVDSAEISRIESGERQRPRVETLWKIAPHLGFDPMELVRVARDLPDDPRSAQKADESAEIRRVNRKEKDAGINRVLGERIRMLRAEELIERDELAKQIGVTYGVLTRIELGSSMPDVPILCRIADRFGVSLDYLLGRTEVRTVAVDANVPAQFVIYATDEKAPAGDDPEAWRRYLTELVSLARRTNSRDREIILNLSREMAARKS